MLLCFSSLRPRTTTVRTLCCVGEEHPSCFSGCAASSAAAEKSQQPLATRASEGLRGLRAALVVAPYQHGTPANWRQRRGQPALLSLLRLSLGELYAVCEAVEAA
jgi:hypothetical protein